MDASFSEEVHRWAEYIQSSALKRVLKVLAALQNNDSKFESVVTDVNAVQVRQRHLPYKQLTYFH